MSPDGAPLAVVIAACSDVGLPHDVFMAWPAADRDALVARWLTPPQD